MLVTHKNTRIRKALFAGTAITLGMMSSNAFAQSTASATAADTAEDVTSAGIQDIVVTAQKREERLRDVPVSILAVSGEKLQDANIARLTDLVTIVPNFTLSLAGNAPTTNLRGFGTYGTQFAQSVGKFTDNVSYSRDLHARLPLFDIERVEVLKGPQVLLYGNSTTAGALNITTKQPGSEFEADASASYEFNHDETIVQGGVTVPLSDWASFRVAGFFQNLDKGWLRNNFTGRDEPTFRNRAVRGTLRLTPTNDLTISLKAEYDRVRDNGGTGQQIRQSTNPNRQQTDITLDDYRTSTASGAPFFSPEFVEVRHETYQADISYDAGVGTISSTTAYLNTRAGGSQSNTSDLPDYLNFLFTHYQQFSQELRFTVNTGSIDYTFGGYFEDNKYKAASVLDANFPAIAVPLPALGRYVDIDQRNKNYSVFANLTAHLTDEFSVTAGARYAILHQNTDQSSLAAPLVTNVTFDTSQADVLAQTDPALCALVQAGFAAVCHEFKDLKRKEYHFQPQVVIQYKPNSDIMFYGKFVKGAKQGGVDIAYGGTPANGVSREEAMFAPETATSFEVGVKGITGDRMLEYSLGVFRTTFEDLQLSAFLGTSQFTTNVGKARTQGVEAEVTFVPVTGLRINATANYLDATFRDFPNGVCTVEQIEAAPPGTVCMQDLSGRPTPFQSKYSGTLNVSYDIEAGDLRVTPGVSVMAKSGYYVGTNDDPLGYQKGLALVDLNLAVTPVDSWWKASVFVRNLTDKAYKEYGVATALIPGGYSIYMSRGRSIGVQVGARF
ncbi:TonB-dependent receptor [Sphingobium subterraneum]|jgi:outer membrane receptor protein involved in Fe transport|uniref:Outer membrane receptor protein involved in Fe transport n=1 Tax=Sphingobium subterraneum TaxID=627688 RepID=A0A841J579_9SPHN|nr:TonB-dependent receptor [Sphingobium subterraneum]MBB6125870.1 outer membrane receptor protein involved in Fe transport [Sphingobium subterraneum]MBP9804749.1 TonB-dependent receptor [Accumulibacter sp.]